MASDNKIVWKCPKCGAKANEHGKGDCCDPSFGSCMGFLCECDEDDIINPKSHGEALNNICKNACCYHCGWKGKFPKPPKGLQAWEKKALAEGWTPPQKRLDELNIK